MPNLSYPFSPFQINSNIFLRPMLPVTLKKSSIEFPTTVMLDSGSDTSMVRTEIIEDYFLINLSTLKEKGKSKGIGGAETKFGIVDLKMEFGYGNLFFEENIPFRVPLDSNKNPPHSLIGRDPFFYKYRVDFRMGYTTSPALGKFVIYPETHKRDSEKYVHPPTVLKKFRK